MTDSTDHTPVQHRIRYDPTRRGGETAYRAAKRHSRLVRTLRIVLPALAVGGILLFWASAHFIPSDIAGLISNAGIDMKSNSVVMKAPHISGFEGTRRAYEVTAARAIQSLDDPKVLTFEQINAHIGLGDTDSLFGGTKAAAPVAVPTDAGTATIVAGTGVYDGNRNWLDLAKNITVETTTGYSAKFQQARIDLTKGAMRSSSPLEIHGKEGSLRADSMNVTDRGKHIVFTGNVSVTFIPSGKLVTAPEAQ